MDYKLQFKSFDPVVNATKVAIKQDHPYRVFEEVLPNNRMAEEDSALVEAVLNIVRMELDTSGAVVAIKKELDKSVKANNEAITKIQALTKDNEDKAVQIKNIKNVADWAVLVAVTNTDHPIDPTLFARGLELVDVAQTGKVYQPYDIFVIENPGYTPRFKEGKLVMIQVNEEFTYNGETLEELEKGPRANGKLEVWKWEIPKELNPPNNLETQPVAQPES